MPPRRARQGSATFPTPEARFPLGWYAIDRETLLRVSGDYEYLRQFEPAAWAGYGFLIYEITPQRAAELQRQWDEVLEDKP